MLLLANLAGLAGAFTLAAGTPVTVDVVPSVNPGYDGSAACSVQAVTFSDGSTWQTI